MLKGGIFWGGEGGPCSMPQFPQLLQDGEGLLRASVSLF